MNKNKILEKIAKEELGLDTLETRKMDELDFHDMSVWQLKTALEAAYEAGRTASASKPSLKEKDEKLFHWDDINEAMIQASHSGAHIARFLGVLIKIRKGK